MAADPTILLLHGWLFAAALMFVLWIVQRAIKDAGIVDVGWCVGIGTQSIYYAVASQGWAPRRLLVATLTALWATRLSLHLVFDRIVGREEDFRYRTIRESKKGARAQWHFAALFAVQPFLIAYFGIPLLVLMAHSRPTFGLWEGVGSCLAVLAILGETAADRQLARFRVNPDHRGRTCREGLWRYSRHPNYFFEWLFWCSFALMAVGAPRGWLALLAPVGILFPLLLMTGIPSTEPHAAASRGEDYRDYQRSTSAFVPWFPRRQERRSEASGGA